MMTEPHDPSLPPLTGSLMPASLSAPSQSLQRARLLLACYRRGEAEDPETYVAAVAALLDGYPEDVRAFVADPRTGIAGKVKFLPTLSEVRDACEAAMEPRRQAERRGAEFERRQKILDERWQWQADQAAAREQDVRRLEECAAELRSRGDPQRRVPNTMTREQAEAKLEAAILSAREPLSPKLAADIKRLMALPSSRVEGHG
jgi:hypothetical protein